MSRAQRMRERRGSSRRSPRRPQVVAQRGGARGARVRKTRINELAQPTATHLLIAEDDREMRRFLVQSFEEEGYRVTEAGDGEELRRRLSTSAPEILVSDIRLPGFTGLELLAELRRSDWSLPVILITAFGDESVHREGKRLGAAMVLDKPFDVEDLVSAVRTLVPAG